MRLGQGFNSYTHQVCLDKAVLPDTAENRARLAKSVTIRDADALSAADESTDRTSGVSKSAKAIENGAQPAENGIDVPGNGILSKTNGVSEQFPDPLSSLQNLTQTKLPTNVTQVPPWVKPQIVTYSSRFVDKLSDITDSMNISGSLSIKTATIGGTASGQFVDSDKFKSSDINFFLQVKVTNQIHDAKTYNIFNKISSVTQADFPNVYGDTFISGWEEGGELNAILSVKVLDKSKIFQVKASIEAEMTTPSIAGKVEVKADIEKSNLSKETETTIAVNWSGGGSIKNPSEDWSIDSLKKAAAAFPDLVAITPQRTNAILTKYTSLDSFHRQQTNFKPLDYENAGIYTGALLDAYMDYKSLWKNISLAMYELKGNRATIDMGEPLEEMAALAKVRKFPVDEKMPEQKRIDDKESLSNEEQLALAGVQIQKHGSDLFQIPVFQPTFAGLIQARKICRFEMTKIVREVDLVANDPTLACSPARDMYFLHPLVFEQLLPLVRALSPENALLGIQDPAATLLLGYSQPKTQQQSLPPVFRLKADLKEHTIPLRQSVERVSHKARDYFMEGCVGPVSEKNLHSLAQFFNDLERLDQTYRVTEVAV